MTESRPQLKKLFTRLRIGTAEIKNRIVMPAMGTRSATEDGYVNNRLVNYYEERAKGGAGVVIVENTRIDRSAQPGALCIDSDEFIPGLSQLAKVIKSHGAFAMIQIGHSATELKPGGGGSQWVGPSSILLKEFGFFRELAVGDIHQVVEMEVRAAERAKKAGFDGVEIHSCHEGLEARFLSPLSNKREDEYGGTPENRARLLLEVIKAIKESLGQSYPVWCRINGREFGIDGGLTLDETLQVAPMIQRAGADAIDVSAMGYGKEATISAPSRPGQMVSLAEAVKKVVTIPIITAGRLDPELGEKILQENKADLIAMGRRLIADPELPDKALSGQFENIRPCIACTQCVESVVLRHQPLRCTVNPAVGREREFRVGPAERKKKVMVIGGGPGGMEAATVAALRGHDVTLYEKDSNLGGQLVLATLPPNKGEIKNLTSYLINQVGKSGAAIELQKEVNAEVVKSVKPDTVIIAAGVMPFIPEVRGFERKNVVRAEDVLAEKVKVGEHIVIVGGSLVGCETADFLTEKGGKVTVLTRSKKLASEMLLTPRRQLLDRLIRKGVTTLTDVKYDEITTEGVTITTGEGKKKVIRADTIVLATGSEPNNKLRKALEGKVSEVYSAGDCVEPRGIIDAIYEGWRIGNTI